MTKNIQQQIQDFSKLIKQYPYVQEFYVHRAILYEKSKQYQKAIEDYKMISPTFYISFDIDGLDASLCPNTGTPVPGGLEYEQAIYLLETIAKEHRIVGFDLNEVAPSKDGKDEWDANVGGRLLYKLSLLAASHILK